MFGRRKKDAFREQALKEMYKFATCIEGRDLELFGVLLKAQFDEQYSKNMPPIVAAVSVGGPFFATCVQMMESGDQNYLGIYSRYAPFHGAPLCQGSCPLLYFSSISQVGGIGR